MKFSPRLLSAILWILLLVLLILLVMPVIWTVLNAFKSNFDIMNHPFSLPKTFDLSNIIGAWQLGHFNIYLKNTFVVTISVIILAVILSSPAAYAFAQLTFKGSNMLFYLLFVGMSVPSQAVVISVFYRLKSFHMINSLTGLILVLVGLGVPFNIFLMRNTYKSIPKELRESAYIDGASEWRTFLTIFFPLGKAGTLALIVFAFVDTWNEYMYPLVLLISPAKYVVSIGVASFQTELQTNFGYIFGAAVLSLIPSILVYLIFQRSFVQGVTVGSTKG